MTGSEWVTTVMALGAAQARPGIWAATWATVVPGVEEDDVAGPDEAAAAARCAPSARGGRAAWWRRCRARELRAAADRAAVDAAQPAGVLEDRSGRAGSRRR